MIYKYKNFIPQIHPSVFIAPDADIIGNVSINRDSSVWFHVTIRGDVHYIKIGSETNIQDNSVIHVTNRIAPVNIGDRVTVGHGVTMHGCTVKNNVLVGMKALILDDAEIAENSIVAAGTVVREGTKFPPGVLIAGVPAKVKRELSESDINKNLRYARNYVEYKNIYLNPDYFGNK